jgi:hypothetical protein
LSAAISRSPWKTLIPTCIKASLDKPGTVNHQNPRIKHHGMLFISRLGFSACSQLIQLINMCDQPTKQKDAW